MRNVAVVLAGGTGTRVGLNIPKQLIKIAGKPIIEHTIAAMQASPVVDEIIVMMAPGLPRRGPGHRPERRLRQGQPDPGGRRHPQRHHGGGAGRARRRGVQRPAARRGPAAGLPDHHRGQRRGAGDLRGGRHRHPVRRHRHRGRARTTPVMADVLPRHLLRRGQTPQSFRLSTIRAAYAKAAAGPELHRDRRLHGGAALPARGADRGRARARAQHEGDRADRRLHRRQAVPAHVSADHPEARSRRRTTAQRLDGKTMVVFGGSYGIGGDIAELARQLRRRPCTPSPARPPTPTSSAAATSPPPPSRCWPRPAGSTSW